MLIRLALLDGAAKFDKKSSQRVVNVFRPSAIQFHLLRHASNDFFFLPPKQAERFHCKLRSIHKVLCDVPWTCMCLDQMQHELVQISSPTASATVSRRLAASSTMNVPQQFGSWFSPFDRLLELRQNHLSSPVLCLPRVDVNDLISQSRSCMGNLALSPRRRVHLRLEKTLRSHAKDRSFPNTSRSTSTRRSIDRTNRSSLHEQERVSSSYDPTRVSRVLRSPLPPRIRARAGSAFVFFFVLFFSNGSPFTLVSRFLSSLFKRILTPKECRSVSVPSFERRGIGWERRT